VSFYTATSGKATWTVQLKDGPELQHGEITCTSGLNQFVYGMDIQPDAVKSYTKKLNESVKDAKKMVDPKKSDSDKFYLQKGTYILILQKDGKTVQTGFVVE
jgi:hypothetical protein